MPRNPGQEIFYQPLAPAEIKIKAANEAIAGFEKFAIDVEEPVEALLFRLYIPKVTVKKLNATCTIFLEDVTGAAQIIQEAIFEGITAASNTGPVIVERRYQPSKDATVEPERFGERSFTLKAEASSEEVLIPANTAKCVAFLQVLSLARQ